MLSWIFKWNSDRWMFFIVLISRGKFTTLKNHVVKLFTVSDVHSDRLLFWLWNHSFAEPNLTWWLKGNLLGFLLHWASQVLLILPEYSRENSVRIDVNNFVSFWEEKVRIVKTIYTVIFSALSLKDFYQGLICCFISATSKRPWLYWWADQWGFSSWVRNGQTLDSQLWPEDGDLCWVHCSSIHACCSWISS